MKYLLFLVIIMCSLISFAKPIIRIGIVDTGYFLTDPYNNFIHFCEDVESKDFTKEGMEDYAAHGQNIMHIITDGLNYNDYCIVMVKVIGRFMLFNFNEYTEALKYIQNANLDIINMSIEGELFYLEEDKMIKSILNSGLTIVASIGNRNKDLSSKCTSYPACNDKRVIVVGSLDKNKNPSDFSSYGISNMVWEVGENITAGGLTQKGTSQAAAKHTRRLVNNMIKNGVNNHPICKNKP